MYISSDIDNLVDILTMIIQHFLLIVLIVLMHLPRLFIRLKETFSLELILKVVVDLLLAHQTAPDILIFISTFSRRINSTLVFLLGEQIVLLHILVIVDLYWHLLLLDFQYILFLLILANVIDIANSVPLIIIIFFAIILCSSPKFFNSVCISQSIKSMFLTTTTWRYISNHHTLTIPTYKRILQHQSQLILSKRNMSLVLI